MKLTITKEFEFDAAHKLGKEEIFGNCSRLHGHTYKLFVTVGTNAMKNGMVMNFTELKQIVNGIIIKDLDHHYLNEVSWLKKQFTTCENMVTNIWERLEPELKEVDIVLVKLQLYESPTSCATVELG